MPKCAFGFRFQSEHVLRGLDIPAHPRLLWLLLQDDFVTAFNGTAANEVPFALICWIINVVDVVGDVYWRTL